MQRRFAGAGELAVRSLAISTIILVLSASVQGSSVEPAVRYTVTLTGPATGERQYQVVSSANGHVRADLSTDAMLGYDAILWRSGAPVVALNSKIETWYELRHAGPFAPHSRFLTPLSDGTATKVRWRLSNPDVSSAGERRYTGHLTYEVHDHVGGERVKVSCESTFEIVTTPSVDRKHWRGAILPRTSYEAVDAVLAAAEPAIAGFPIRLGASVWRKYAGGSSMNDTISVHVQNVHEQVVERSVFELPATYNRQDPIYGVPGR